MKSGWARFLQLRAGAKATTIAGVSIFLLTPSLVSLLQAADTAPFLEPGSLRLSHSLSLEGVFHRTANGEQVLDDDLNKSFIPNGQGKKSWESEWGESLLTEVAAKLNRAVAGRVLFNVQGDYADRFWRPINIDHYESDRNNHIYVRQAEGNIDQDNWYLHGFSGVSQNGWGSKGDLFNFYPGIYPERDYLGTSGYFGVFPAGWRQDQYQNISKRRIPEGGELGGAIGNMDAAVAYGSELKWGYNHNAYGRAGATLGSGRLNVFLKDEDVPYDLTEDPERDQAVALTYVRPSDEGWDFNVGGVYEPYRVGDEYFVDREVDSGNGLLGSNHNIETKTVKHSDGLGGKVALKGNIPIKSFTLKTQIQAERLGVVAGNKEDIGARLGADFGSYIQGFVDYTYQRPIEGPIPFLYEGTPDNVLAIAANPRGPESPFTVDWENREASFLTTTVNFDLTPGSNLYLYDPTSIALWNMNPQEDAKMVVSLQHRMSDYKTTTDRQYYYDESGNILWEPPGHSGAWASKHPLHEFRALVHGLDGTWKWTLGVAGGQTPAISGLAYSTSTASSKPVTEYISFEFKLEKGHFAYWGHYGTGVWGPEENIHPYFGESYDRIYGLGVSYNISSATTWDVSYLGARQDDNMFRPEHLGSFDEVRTVFTHRFGFLFMFQPPSPAGTRIH